MFPARRHAEAVYHNAVSIRLLAIDIDGTLLNSRHELPSANVEAICAATAQGVEITLVTGRRFDFAMPVARNIPCALHLIVNNGAMVKSPSGYTHLRKLLPMEIACAVLKATLAFRAGAAIVFDRPRENQVIWEVMDWNDPGRRSYFERNREFIAQMRLEDALTEDPIQVMFTGPVAPMREVRNLLNSLPCAKDFSLAYTEYENRDFALVDVLNRDCSKGAALAEWAHLRSISREQVMAIGDNHNDEEMLAFAGIAVVMGNSVPTLQRDGWHVTLSNDECGVAAAISRWVLQPGS
jgi:hypothetical protein